MCEELRGQLDSAGIAAHAGVQTAQHIYSICRKMQRKQLDFSQLFDVRAVRVVVGSIPECYAALGIVHGQWPSVPGIRRPRHPKGNGYRSIHTAVIGPQATSLRGADPHPQKCTERRRAGCRGALDPQGRRPARRCSYQRKIEVGAPVLEPAGGDRADADRDLIEGVRTGCSRTGSAVLTPKGEVVDLPHRPRRWTLAYSVHRPSLPRSSGQRPHRALTHQLTNGESVEIITGKHDAPSRDWLAPEQSCLVSPRNRSKVRAWFRKQDAGDNRSAGRAIAERELARIGARAST